MGLGRCRRSPSTCLRPSSRAVYNNPRGLSASRSPSSVPPTPCLPLTISESTVGSGRVPVGQDCAMTSLWWSRERIGSLSTGYSGRARIRSRSLGEWRWAMWRVSCGDRIRLSLRMDRLVQGRLILCLGVSRIGTIMDWSRGLFSSSLRGRHPRIASLALSWRYTMRS